MIKDQDVSALDKLIDFYGEYLSVRFRDLDFDLGDLREFLIDNNISLSIDVYNVNRNGIFDIDNNGKYRLKKYELPVVKALPINNYRGVRPETKNSLRKFYRDVNRENVESYDEDYEEPTSTIAIERDSLYKHTKIGFSIEDDSK